MESPLQTRISFLLYRYRFLLVYVLIGFSSIVAEILMFIALSYFKLPELSSKLCGVATSLGVAYFLNIRFNFKVPHGKRSRAFLFFVVISTGSFLLNTAAQSLFIQLNPHLKYEQTRVITSGMLFLIAYVLHRRFTFADAKQVGVAVYANKVEDVEAIRRKVGLFPDFIHMDVVDDTFRPGTEEPNTHRIEGAHACWPQKQLHAHLMTRRPTRYFDWVLPYADTVIVHVESDEDLNGVLGKIRAAGKRAGLCVTMSTPLENVRPFAGAVDLLMLLAIEKPGHSGQELQLSVVERITEIHRWPERKHFELCVDGGVNERNIGLLSVEKIVSGSSVLNHPNPTRQIMRLQTSSNYEAI
jgi:ribulose-phosphate 3-epimerase